MHIELDGSEGEGGGQILRSALSLSAITGTPIKIHNIRANRRRPGLRRQHLTCVLAVAEITDAEVDGAEVGSRSLWFRPRRAPAAGDYRFDIGTAGSTTLLLQAVLWPLVSAGKPSTVVLCGGTHNPMAPPYEFLARTFAPAIRRAGVGLGLELERAGFYPKGGGRLKATIKGGAVEPLEIESRGPAEPPRALIVLANLAEHIARRETRVLLEQLGDLDKRAVEIERPECHGAGNLVHVILPHEAITEVVTGFGERGVPAERVATDAAVEALGYLASDAPVGEHLADQLVIPLALAGSGAVRCTSPSLHTRTNVSVVNRLVDGVELSLEDAGDGSWWLRARSG